MTPPDSGNRESVKTLACTQHEQYVNDCVWCRAASVSLSVCTSPPWRTIRAEPTDPDLPPQRGVEYRPEDFA